jgi:hypothetical protein
MITQHMKKERYGIIISGSTAMVVGRQCATKIILVMVAAT